MQREKVIIVRLGEIYLKGKNRYIFENVLVSNIKSALRGTSAKVIKTTNRIIVQNLLEDEIEEIVEKVKSVFGISSLSLATKISSELNLIEEFCNEIKLKGTFKVEVKRADKTFPVHSNDLEKSIGSLILRNNEDLKVDIHNPENFVNIDIREGGETFISFEKIKGLGGMPIGTSGRGLLMLSGGIDSPVAGYLMGKRGLNIYSIYFHSHPYTSDQARTKVRDLAKVVSKYTGKMKLFEVPFTKIQEEIRLKCDSRFTIAVMRRVMYSISEKVARNNRCDCLITGENLAQVASQTVQSITCSNSVLQEMPMFRPLISFDKLETIEISKKIGAYDISILPYEDCCTVFVPRNPIIKPKVTEVIKEQSKIDNLEELINEAIENIQVVEID